MSETGRAMDYQVTIGLETHVQLRTQSKMFCACSTRYGAQPNTQVCPVCLGYPGVMPVMNEAAIRLTVLTGLMIGSRISSYSTFDRKSYFYPDMPKNYQISQYDKPLCEGGSVEIDVEGRPKQVRICRIHLEEDVAKNMHFKTVSGVDFNRSGVPLMEIVTEPDLASPAEAFSYLLALKQILEYAGVSDCNLEQGNVRCDVNCSVRPAGQEALGTKTELKNLNTFKGVLHALEYEAARQIDELESGGTIRQETRRWDVDTGRTSSMRSKENEHDYRYFPEPDLMPVVLDRERLAAWEAELPERPRERRRRLVSQYGLPDYDAGVLVSDRQVADFFEETAALSKDPKTVSNWVMTELLRMLAETGQTLDRVCLTPRALADLIELVQNKTVNGNTAKEIFAILFEKGGDPAKIVESGGLSQVSDEDAIVRFVEQAMAENEQSVEDYRQGKTAAARFLVGQVMRLSRGKANPQVVNEILVGKLESR